MVICYYDTIKSLKVKTKYSGDSEDFTIPTIGLFVIGEHDAIDCGFTLSSTFYVMYQFEIAEDIS